VRSRWPAAPADDSTQTAGFEPGIADPQPEKFAAIPSKAIGRMRRTRLPV